MGVKFEGKSYAGNMPVFWRGEAKILPGGYKLLQTFPKGTVIPKGTPLHIVIGTLTAAVSKYAKVVSGGTTTKPRVPKGTLFQRGKQPVLRYLPLIRQMQIMMY